MRRRTTIIRGEEEGEETVAIYPIRSDLVPYYPIPVHPNLHPFPVLSFPPVTPWDALRIQLNPLPPFPLPPLLSFFPSPPYEAKKERKNHPSPSPNSEETRAQQPNRKNIPRDRPTPNPSPTMKRTQYGTEWSKPQYPDRNRLNIFFMRAS